MTHRAKHRRKGDMPDRPAGNLSREEQPGGRTAFPAGALQGLEQHSAPPLAGPGQPVTRFPGLPVAWISAIAFGTVLTAAAVGTLALFGLWTYGLVAALPALATACALLPIWRLWLLLGREQAAARRERLRLTGEIERQSDLAWELRESEELYRGLAEAFGDVVVHRDSEGRVLFANSALGRLLETEAAALIGKPLELEVLEDVALAETGGLDAGGNPAGLVRELCIATPSGPRWFRWIDLPMRDESSGRTARRSVARDITDHKLTVRALQEARNRAEQANRSKSRFLATASHEMRTPLNGILGMSGLLRETGLTQEQATYNSAIESSGAALLALIEDMLDITAIEAGRFELRSEAFDPARIVEEVCELLSSRAFEKGIAIAATVSPQTPRLATGDAGRLRQVLVNLVGNAIKFTDRGGVLLSLRAQSASEGEAVLEFAVRDTGPGIAAESLQKIFEEFVQLDSASTRRHGGAGLGLAISRAIIQRLGGEIEVRSEPGKWAEFRFSIRVPVAESAAQGTGAELCGHRVLVVSTGEVEAEAIAATIVEAGGEAMVCRSLPQAGEAMRDPARSGREFTALILDPSDLGDVRQALAQLTAHGAADTGAIPSCAVPFCAVLLRPSERAGLPDYLGGGFDGYLVRPVRRASLVRLLAERQSASVGSGAAGEARPELPGPHPRRFEILIAEDNAINALLARTVLERAGQAVTVVGDGRQALSAFAARASGGKPFDLVLMDMHMPGTDGIAAIRAIRRLERREGLARARILTLSADQQASAREKSARAGSDGFLVKPVAPAELVGVLSALPDPASMADLTDGVTKLS